MLQATLARIAVMSPIIAKMIRTGAPVELKAEFSFTETGAWSEHFSDEKQDEAYQMNLEFIYQNMEANAKDTAGDLLYSDPDLGDTYVDHLAKKLMDVEEEIGEEYEWIFNDSVREALAPRISNIHNNYESGDSLGLSRDLDDEVWEEVAEKLGMDLDDVVAAMVHSDWDETETGISIDLTKRRSLVAKVLMDRQSEGEDMSYLADELQTMVESIAETMVNEEYEHLSSGQAFENIHSDLILKYQREFVEKWAEPSQKAIRTELGIVSDIEDEPMEGEGPGDQNQPPLPGMENIASSDVIIQTAEDNNFVMHGHIYLGEAEGEHYFYEENSGGIISGEVIDSDDMELKTLEYWQSFFEGEPDQIADMMERGFLAAEKDAIVRAWVQGEDTSERTIFQSDSIDSENEDKEELEDEIRAWFDGEENSEQKISDAISGIEENTQFHVEFLDADYDSYEEADSAMTDYYESNFADYVSSDSMIGLEEVAAQEVMDVDGVGHGLDAEELESDHYILIGRWRGISADPNELPQSIGERFKTILHGGRPEQRSEPLEEGLA